MYSEIIVSMLEVSFCHLYKQEIQSLKFGLSQARYSRPVIQLLQSLRQENCSSQVSRGTE